MDGRNIRRHIGIRPFELAEYYFCAFEELSANELQTPGWDDLWSEHHWYLAWNFVLLVAQYLVVD